MQVNTNILDVKLCTDLPDVITERETERRVPEISVFLTTTCQHTITPK